jgi:hypothetical protein
MTILHRVYYNGDYVVATLEETSPSGLSFPEAREFDLNAKNLEERIKNRENLGLDASSEKIALSMIRGHKDYKP